jgi:oligoribonuclease NrnB/cAMP/cGMP phosphodiesterase (DHH superfamily)
MPYCITHNDLDGIGCAILMEKVFPEVKTFPIDYRELPKVLPRVLEKAKMNQVYITDIALTEELAKLCDDHGKVQHVDHHISSKKVSDKYPWSLFDVNNCATYLLWKMLSQYANLEDYKEFVELVDNYDTWGHGTQPTEKAKDLNRLLKMLGPDVFAQRFKHKSSVKFNDVEEAIINVDKHMEERYLQEAITYTQAMRDKDGNIFLLVAAEQYTSSLGNYLLHQFEEAEYVVILDMLHDKASLRSKGKVNVADLAKACGGGGHAKAAGFLMNDTAVKAFWRCNSCEFRAQLGERREPGDTDLDK